MRSSPGLFALTHNYTGYPMVRQARGMVGDGDLGEVRVVQVEYPQEWLTTKLEDTGQKQAAWRTDPGAQRRRRQRRRHRHARLQPRRVRDRAGGREPGRGPDGLRAGPRPGRQRAHAAALCKGGARGALWSSQVAPGNENGLRLRVYGSKGGLDWSQEQPNTLAFTPFGEPPRLIRRAGAGASPVAAHASRIPAGHPEGYLEGFAQLYRDFAEQIAARWESRDPDPACLLVPGINEGVRGMRFIAAAVESSQADAAWTRVG